MKYLILLACGLAIVSLPVHQAARDVSRLQSAKLVTDVTQGRSCLSESDLAKSLAAFSSPLTKPESNREMLLRYGKRSSRCRAQIIAALMRAMDKPDLNLERDQESFFLWHYGGEVLGYLRASEALDLLIRNLGVTDGESISMTHYPAVETVIRMGPISQPRLLAELKQNRNPYIRRLAVFCIATIGGASAKRALVEALPKETDKCVIDLMKVALGSFGNRHRPNHVAAEDRVKWFSAFYCLPS